MRAHAELGDVLREQRQSLVQRELLLDTMVQNTPVAMLLVAAGGDGERRVVFANVAARKLLHGGWKLEGQRFEELMAATPVEMRESMSRGGDSLFAIGSEEEDAEEQVYHLARRHFRLKGRQHELLLLLLLTSELRRQEVQTWEEGDPRDQPRVEQFAGAGGRRWRTRARSWCGAAATSAWMKSSPPSRSARAIWKASSAATRASPNCRSRCCRPWTGTASWPGCSTRSLSRWKRRTAD